MSEKKRMIILIALLLLGLGFMWLLNNEVNANFVNQL